ncbi:MFS general substrate transporter [Aspergillus heteromorphus CBS 117.55]|uniref:Autophagy-related protein n=1 Tax=Aspergillus heteromorphus CBS 117.55 TaxID=1448321 RepID=A0A317WW82_9EURO|nr:MFS general substrate transporter [Aspergillus heteromorphus CBS 117.55]PWY89068.1 MFS general substrate transporter [Aspergillus heteromorphus CBS 117.55]
MELPFPPVSREEDVQARAPRYPGEDTKPTTRREIWGWYAYGIAAEVFAVCGVGSFLPLTLEQLARERGFLQTSHLPCVGPGSPSATGEDNDEQCVVPLMGLQINTASFAMYTFSLAVLVQALTLISFSALADYGMPSASQSPTQPLLTNQPPNQPGNNRKTLLLSFGFLGAFTSMLFVFVTPSVFPLGAVLVVIGVVCLGSSFVVLNSFLPVLVANDPSIEHETKESEELHSLNTDSDGHSRTSVDLEELPRLRPATDAGTSPELQLSTRISSQGVGLGYCAAVFVQILSILLLFGLSKTSLPQIAPTLPLRFVLLLVGGWWFLFTLVSRSWLRNRPGPPLESTHGLSRPRATLHLITFAWKSLWHTTKIAFQLREVVLFLIAWFLLSDAIATVSGTAILFARTELKMSTTSIALLSITATVSGMSGAFLWPLVSRHFGLKSNHTIMLCIALFELIPLYGMLAYIPLFKRWGVIGLQQPWEIYPLGVVHGIVSGGLASYCRSFFGLLIPPGSEAAFYALYAATDKGSSFIGPAIVGGLIDATGQVRSGFFFIAVLIVLPIPLVWMVDAEKGRREGVAVAEKLDGDGDVDGDWERGEEGEGLLRG